MFLRWRKCLCALFVVGVLRPATATQAPPPTSRRESILAQSEYYGLAQIVGIITLEVPDQNGGTVDNDVCTGFAIAPDRIITARHCFFSDTGGTIPRTEAYITLGLKPSQVTTYTLKKDFEIESESEDFVVMRTEGMISQFSPGLFKASGSSIKEDQDLFIIHHPAPGSVLLTRMDCRVGRPALKGKTFFHTCDTDPGSSGAPVFDAHFGLVGIHLQGGRTDNPNSFNSGTTLQSILADRPALAQILSSDDNLQSKAPESAIESEYSLSTNGEFIKRQGQPWVYAVGGEETPCVQQTGPTDRYTLWNLSHDAVFRFPIIGGTLLVRSGTQSSWTSIGEC